MSNHRVHAMHESCDFDHLTVPKEFSKLTSKSLKISTKNHCFSNKYNNDFQQSLIND